MKSQDFISKAIKTIKISGFEEGEEIEVKVKKPSLMHLISYGKIPNPLMPTVIKIFEGKLTKQEAEKMAHIDELKLIDIFVSGTLIEPAYEEVKEYLTDEQRNEIFTFAIGGLKALDNFRTNETNVEPSANVENI